MVLESFKPTTTLAVHWDGKLMSDLMGTDKVELDRCPGGVSQHSVPLHWAQKVSNSCFDFVEMVNMLIEIHGETVYPGVE